MIKAPFDGLRFSISVGAESEAPIHPGR